MDTSSIATQRLLRAFYTTRCLGQSVEDSEVTAEARQKHRMEEGSGSFIKRLLVKPTAPIRALFGEIGRYHRNETFEGFGDTRILLSAAQPRYQAKMDWFQTRLRGLVSEFVASYPDHLAAEKKLLGDRYDPTDYPIQSAVATKFFFTFGFEPLAQPNEFQCNLLAGDTVARIQQEHEARLAAAVAQVETESLQRGLDLLKDLANELSQPNPTIYDTQGRRGIVPRMREFVERIPERNLTGNPLLTVLHQEIRSKLILATETLRGSKLARSETAEAARSILAQFSGPGNRKLNLKPAPAAIPAAVNA